MEHFEQWLKRKNIKYEIDKKSINRFNKQKEVSFKKLKAIRPRNAAESQAIAQVHKSCKMGMIMSGIAFGLNAISAAMMYPMYMEALQSGNFPNMSDLAGGGVNSGSTTPGPSSVWG